MKNTDLNVLVVDDVQGMRSYIIRTFSSLGIKKFTEASNGEEAWDIIQNSSNKFDLVLSDINMPKMNGIDLVRCIRTSHLFSDTPFFTITAEVESRAKNEAIQAGVTEYILKPLDSSNLHELLENVFEKNIKGTTFKKQGKIVFENKNSLNEMSKVDVLKKSMRPLIATIKGIFRDQCQILTSPNNSFQLNKGEVWKGDEDGAQLICTTLLKSEKLECTYCMAFSKNIFLKLIGQMFGSSFIDVTDEIREVPGEWLNLILGRLKGIFNDEWGMEVRNTIPVTIFGEHMIVPPGPSYPLIVIPFDSESGTFHFIISYGSEGLLPWDKKIFGI